MWTTAGVDVPHDGHERVARGLQVDEAAGDLDLLHAVGDVACEGVVGVGDGVLRRVRIFVLGGRFDDRHLLPVVVDLGDHGGDEALGDAACRGFGVAGVVAPGGLDGVRPPGRLGGGRVGFVEHDVALDDVVAVLVEVGPLPVGADGLGGVVEELGPAFVLVRDPAVVPAAEAVLEQLGPCVQPLECSGDGRAGAPVACVHGVVSLVGRRSLTRPGVWRPGCRRRGCCGSASRRSARSRPRPCAPRSGRRRAP